MAADHQRRRKRPRLRGEIFHAAAERCRLPPAPRGAPLPRSIRRARRSRRDTTTWSARKRGERPSTQRSPAIGSMMTTGSVRGKCSALQAGQSRRQPACTTSVGAPQLGQKRCRACQPSTALASASGGRCSGVDQALHRDRAQIGDLQIVARLERLDRLRIEPQPEPRRVIHQAEKHGLARAAERARLGRREQRIAASAMQPSAPPVRRRSHKRRRADAREFLQRRVIAAQSGGAIDAARDIAELRRRTEIGAGGHDQQRPLRITRPLRAAAADGNCRRAPAAAIAGRARLAWRRNRPTSRSRRASRADSARGRG